MVRLAFFAAGCAGCAGIERWIDWTHARAVYHGEGGRRGMAGTRAWHGIIRCVVLPGNGNVSSRRGVVGLGSVCDDSPGKIPCTAFRRLFFCLVLVLLLSPLWVGGLYGWPWRVRHGVCYGSPRRDCSLGFCVFSCFLLLLSRLLLVQVLPNTTERFNS
ncbi:hypothetical protein BT67DRAFT_281720 [Trichocladium antarcticum]|uniref:Uncharacterized protein n=1 Tax=Trichocladium antarcticum TaxID=1450529 RepID=A0AAN6UKP9_9PEZI|nr:hypothetical protein BT67DRAFT_281720 [Trichocladium antarcticum]